MKLILLIKFILTLNLLFMFGCNAPEKIIIKKLNPVALTLTLNSLTTINLANSTSYSFSGECSDNGLMVSYDIDSGAVTGSVTCTSNSWSVTGLDISAASDGPAVLFTIDYTDGSGNIYQETGTALKDTVPPTQPTLVTVADTSTVYSETITMTGACEDDSVVAISGAGIAATQSITCGGSTYSLKVTLTTGAGAKAFAIDATDTVGNTATTLAGSYTLATPLITFDTSSDVNVYSQTTSDTLTAVDCSGISELLLTEATATPASGDAGWSTCSTAAGNYSVTIGDTNQGDHPIYLWIKSSTGDINLAATDLNFVYDTVPPIVTSLTLAGGAANIALPSIAFDVVASDISSPLYEMRTSESSVYADNSWVPYSASGTANVSGVSGTKNVYIWVKDQAGNVSLTSATDDIELEYGDPPKVSVDQPDGNTDFIASDAVSIEWSCTAGTGTLASPAIPEIDYTIDEGETFTSITTNQTNNLTATTGSFAWTLPAPLAGTPFRIRVRCATTAGVISSGYSQVINTSGWKIFVGDPWYALENINATIADVSSEQRSTVTGDKSSNTYYVKDNAVMKINASTGLVTTFAGDLNNSGCTMATGVNPLNFTFDEPVILGTDINKDFIFVMSEQCNKIFRIAFSDSSVTEWAAFGTSGYARYYLTKNQILIFLNGNNLYYVDLNTVGAVPVLIMGNGTCNGNRVFNANGTNVNTVALEGANNNCNDFGLFANDDASKIWISPYGASSAYRLDRVGMNYLMGETNLGWSHGSRQNCIPSPISNYTYCSNRFKSRDIFTFNLTTELWESSNSIPFENNDNSGYLGLGSYLDRLVAIYSLNEIKSIRTHTSDPWEFVTIAGKPLTTFGNGDPLHLAALYSPIDIEYNINTQYLWIKSFSDPVRRIDMSSFPYNIDTGYSVGGAKYFALDPSGTRMISLTSCTRLYLDRYNITGLTISSGGRFLSGPCNSLTGSFPPITGTNAIDGSARFGAGQIRYFSHPIYHSSLDSYFGTRGPNDVFMYLSDSFTLTRVAGVAGVGGYNPADNGTNALGASFTRIRQLQEILTGPNAGDILVWDEDRIRLITVTTDSASPKVYDILDLNLAPSFVNEEIIDFYYDESSEQAGGLGTGAFYYSNDSSEVFKLQTDATKTIAVRTQYDFSGTTLAGEIRITKIPGYLLVLQPNKNRVLKVAE